MWAQKERGGRHTHVFGGKSSVADGTRCVCGRHTLWMQRNWSRAVESGGAGLTAGCRRVNSSLSSDDLILEDLETEGERQLKSLLHHQLETSVSVEQCLSKKRCFAPATVYRPFGQEAAGALTLSEFQHLQENDQETASLRELGLTDVEIVLWKTRNSSAKGSTFGAAPDAVRERLQSIEEKILEHKRILSMPQRFAGSKRLNRREMEIEKALFQGGDRHSFLRALYYQDETQKTSVSGNLQGSSLDALYNDFIKPPVLVEGDSFSSSLVVPESSTVDSSGDGVSNTLKKPHIQEKPGVQEESQRLTPHQPIASLPQNKGPVVVTEHVEFVPEEEIRKNCLSEEDIRKIPRFASYSRGDPSKVLYLKNLSSRVTPKEIFSLFARFQNKNEPQIQLRVLTGRMRGQAFITFPSVAVAVEAQTLVNGYNLLGKPLVIEFGKKQT